MSARPSWMPLLGAIALLAGCPAQPQPPVTASPSASVAPSAAVSATPTASPSRAPAEAHNSDVSEQEGCKYLQEGPATALTAGTDTGSAPVIRSDDRRYDIALAAETPGVVKFTSPTKAEWSFYTNRDVFFVLENAAGTTIAGARLPGTKFCAEVFAHRVFELEPGDYYIELVSAEAATLQVVVEETHPGGAGAGPH